MSGGGPPLRRALPRRLDELERLLSARPPRRTVSGEDWKRAAVAVILRDAAGIEGDEDLEVLLIRRSDDPRDTWSGHIAFPGGRQEPADPDLEGTAIRETLEEVGLDLRGARRLGRLDELAARASLPMRLAITPWAFGWTGPSPDLVLSAEVATAMWVPVSHLGDPVRRVEHPVEHRGQGYNFPGISVGPHVLWGLTLRMVEDLFELLESDPRPGRPGSP